MNTNYIIIFKIYNKDIGVLNFLLNIQNKFKEPNEIKSHQIYLTHGVSKILNQNYFFDMQIQKRFTIPAL